MENKKVVLFLLTMLVLLAFGCGSNPSREEGDVNFRQGNQGLEMRFLQGNPPYTVYEQDILPITIEMFNRGTEPVMNGMLFITGYDPNIITNNPWGGGISGNLPAYGTSIPFRMDDKKTQFNREGGYNVMEFQSGTIELPEGSTTYEIPLVAYACYEYSTLASDTICIDPQPHRTYMDKPCITADVGMGGSQGAPVAVTHAAIENMRDQIRITFTISNVGGGEIVDSQVMAQKCPTSFSPADINIVYVDSVNTLLGPDFKLTCTPNGRIKLVNGYGKIVCTAGIAGDTAFKTPIQIKLDYGYKTYVRQQVQIRGYK
jgi:hypothetical protein